MRLKHPTLLLVVMSVLGVVGSRASAESAWTGAVSFQWNTAANWTNGVPSKTATDTAVFDYGATTGGTITWATGSANQPKNTNFRFVPGARSYTFASSGFVDNQSNTRTFTTDSGMTNAQVFSSHVRIANHAITMNGSGNLSFARFYNENAWADTTFNAGTWAVNDANAVLTIGTFLQNTRGFTFTKTGPGKVVLTGTIDFPYGLNGAAFVSTKINASAGTLDVSAATFNLETHLDAGESLATGAIYTLVNYAGATLVGGSGFSSTGVPAGWQVANDAANSKIVLRGAPKGTVVTAR